MDEFCGGTFWNISLLLDNTWPQLTPCFLDLVVTCAPCVMFWLAVPCHMYLTETNRVTQHYSFPMSHLVVAKLVCCCVLCVLTLLRLLGRASRDLTPAAIVSDAVLLATLILATLMVQYERSRCVITSPPLFIFWLLKTGFDVLPFYTKIMLKDYERDLQDFVQFMMSVILNLTIVILYAFADPVAVFYYNKLNSSGQKACPEATASFLNQLTFAWYTRLTALAKRRDLESTDLWNLMPRDQSATLVPVFERLWAQEVRRCARINKQRSAVSYSSGRETNHRRHSNGVTSECIPLIGDNDHTSTHLVPWVNRLGDSVASNKRHLISISCDSDDTLEGSDEKEESYVSLRREKPGARRSGQSDRARPSLLRVLVRQFGGSIAVFLVQRLVSDSTLIISPLLLGKLITHLNDRQEGREWQGYMLALLLLLSAFMKTAFYTCGCYRSHYVGLQVKSVVIGAVFNKALRINNEAKKKASCGEIVSLMSVDAERLQEFVIRMFFGVTVPVVLIVDIFVLYFYMAEAAFAASLVLVFLTPVTLLAAVSQKKVQEQLLVYKSLRVKVFNEILNGIKMLKLFAWEFSFERRVAEARGQEVRCILKMAMLYLVLGICSYMLSFLMTLATYGWYVLSQTDLFLDPSSAFVTMALLSVLTPVLDSIGLFVSISVQAKVSVKRINDFLCSEELDFDTVSCYLDNPGEAIRVENAAFTWDNRACPVLRNINLTVATGRLIAVVGPVGAGKTSLVNCIMGEMVKLRGKVAMKGRVAYVSQQAWIQNSTVRDNVVFGQPYQRERYNAVIKACQLERDLSILTAGDMTEIGEKGTNLSGGQKQRVSLARAVYSDSDVYLLDDPLSAVDSHVGKALFNDVIGPRGILKGKTRVLVTHGVHWLPQVDEIVVLSQGQISELGSYDQLMQHDGDFAQFLKTYFTGDRHNDTEGSEEEEQLTDPEVLEMRRKIWADVELVTSDACTSGDDVQRQFRESLPPGKKRREKAKRQLKPRLRRKSPAHREAHDEDLGKLILSETLGTRQAPLSVYLHYPKAGGITLMTVAALCFAAFRASSVAASFWLRQWTDDPTLTNQSAWGSEAFVNTNQYYLTYYGLFGILQVVLLLVCNLLYWLRTIHASRRLHDEMVSRLFRAPMAFFDTTPIGRILNRFSQDIDIVDNLLPIILRDLMYSFSVVFSTIIVIIVLTPLSVVILIPLLLIGYVAVAFYCPVSRQCKRMEAVARSPIFAHFSETISGAATIRAYRACERFIAESKTRVDASQVFNFNWFVGLRWIQMCMESVANTLVFVAALLEVVSDNPSGGAAGLSVSSALQSVESVASAMIFVAALLEVVSDDPSGGAAGLSVSSALQMTYIVSYMAGRMAYFDTNIVSVERIKEYSEVPSEAPWISPARRPVHDWPSRGRVELRDYQTRYREGLDLVLKGVSCEIQAGEKIGIVGRTGAGKSSLTLALFRLIEGTGGAIVIDGVNIADIGLHDLRQRLTILPQDPVLFSGPLRFNLDPFEEYEDSALWRALRQAHLHDFVRGLPGGLSYECEEEGLNLSVGQRQLVCLARTLLRKTKILVLDEATSAVDMETDALIQTTVREAFSDCTVLAIAHRLNTIMDYDRILVLEDGTVREFDTPQNLLIRPDSTFAAMLKDAGFA